MFSFFNNKNFNSGYLPFFEGHEIYFKEFGNPQGQKVLFFHAGPGEQIKSSYLEYFNLKKQHIIIFDQRGCGKTISEDIVALNDTTRNIKDAKRLLDYLKINEKVIVAGNSWGSTMALLFAIRYPNLVEKIAVSSVFLARKQDLEWLTRDSGLFYPDMLEEINRQSDGQNPFAHYGKLVFTEDLKSIQTAIKYMVHYEYNLGLLDAGFKDVKIDNKIINTARIALYYSANRYFLEDNQILDNIERIRHIPISIYHNRLDLCCPLKGAWDLYRSMDNATIEIIPDLGHGGKNLKKAFRKQFL